MCPGRYVERAGVRHPGGEAAHLVADGRLVPDEAGQPEQHGEFRVHHCLDLVGQAALPHVPQAGQDLAGVAAQLARYIWGISSRTSAGSANRPTNGLPGTALRPLENRNVLGLS